MNRAFAIESRRSCTMGCGVRTKQAGRTRRSTRTASKLAVGEQYLTLGCSDSRVSWRRGALIVDLPHHVQHRDVDRRIPGAWWLEGWHSLLLIAIRARGPNASHQRARERHSRNIKKFASRAPLDAFVRRSSDTAPLAVSHRIPRSQDSIEPRQAW
jgi:hypothetical protein